MNITKREVNHLYHLAGMNAHQIADKLNITQQDVLNMVMSWDKFYKEATKK